MNDKIKISPVIIFMVISIFNLTSCNKVTLPRVTTSNVILIEQTTAYSGGQVTEDGGTNVTARGVCWNTSENPGINESKTSDSTGRGVFSSYITGLTPNTLYYVKAYATNSEGTVYGNQVSFTTEHEAIPTLTTLGPKTISSVSASCGGDISNEGGIPVTARGVCWNTYGNPSIAEDYTSDGSGAGIFSSILTGLTVNTTYYVRAYATNSIGTAYGNEVIFTHLEPAADIEGNVYSIVTIGTQVWFGENLRTATFNDGSAIPQITEGLDWANMSSPAFCWYNNNGPENKATYGALYNWYAVSSGKLCPAGWHVPTDDEFATLVTYLGGADIAGGKLKEAGKLHWMDPNTGATNGSSFTALPAGGRYNIFSEGGAFTDLGYYTYFWTASESSSAKAWSRDLEFNLKLVNRGEYSKKDGESVRCLKNGN